MSAEVLSTQFPSAPQTPSKQIDRPNRIKLTQGASIGKVVTIKVGPELVPHVVHEDLICSFSEYFKNAFTGKYKEAEDKEIKIADVSPQAFGLFTAWLYTSKLALDTGDAEVQNKATCSCAVSDDTAKYTILAGEKNRTHPIVLELVKQRCTKQLRRHPVTKDEMALVELAIFANRFDVKLLRNVIVDALQQAFHSRDWLPALCSLRKVNDALPASHKTRQYLLYSVLAHLDPCVSQTNLKEVTAVFDVNTTLSWVRMLRCDIVALGMSTKDPQSMYLPCFQTMMTTANLLEGSIGARKHCKHFHYHEEEKQCFA